MANDSQKLSHKCLSTAATISLAHVTPPLYRKKTSHLHVRSLKMQEQKTGTGKWCCYCYQSTSVWTRLKQRVHLRQCEHVSNKEFTHCLISCFQSHIFHSFIFHCPALWVVATDILQHIFTCSVNRHVTKQRDLQQAILHCYNVTNVLWNLSLKVLNSLGLRRSFVLTRFDLQLFLTSLQVIIITTITIIIIIIIIIIVVITITVIVIIAVFN